MNSPPPSMPDDHVAGRRAREVYRYFRPEKRLGAILEKETSSSEDNTTSDGLRSSTSSSNREQSPATPPSSAPSQTELVSPPNSMQAMPESLILGDANSTLNSFAQLAALRLDVDRAFISFSDRDSQFIIAQSAQTTDSTNKYDGLSGGIYAGCSTLDVSTWNMCQDTIALPASRREKGDYEFIISNDMAQDDRYQHLPLVQKKPAFRFFAGTPLTTDSGINVGCFFVLDTKPRVAFSEKDKITMGQMGMLIMDFLKVSRQASEGRRASRLTQGMNHFVEGRSSFQSDFDTIKLLNRESSTSSGSRRRLHRRNTGSVSSRFSRSSSASAHSANSDSDAEVPFLASSYHSSHSASWSAEDKANDEMNPEKDTTWTFRRAANLIRESLELGENSGVAFLEAGNNFLPHRTSDSESSSSPENETIASILSISTAETPYGTAQESSVPYPVANMSEDFLHRLLRRHRRGKIFFLHRDGQLSSSDSEDNSKSTDPFGRRDSIKPKNYKAMKAKDNKLLNLYFPSASQVMFVPLLSAAYSQWYGGCFCWNNVESNVFDPSVELSTVVSFGSSIMAECSRIESLISDRQKADFLGSISHELRSPLHGIMAATEILQTTTLNQYQGSLMETVTACGRTLLDTMNQVLDYSKVLSLRKRLRNTEKGRVSSSELKKLHRSAAHLDTYIPTDISVLAEEVIDGVCVGHFHSRKPASARSLQSSDETNDASSETSLSQSNIDVKIDIAPNNWIYQVPPGAIRRIIMNIFSNAMKYTEAGSVSLKLDIEPSRNVTQEDTITLTVADTGKGISEEFIRSKLFVPFAQEDSLATGSGLGLSIVRSLLKPFGGTFNIQSQVGHGTTVKVMIPLVHSDQEIETLEFRSRSTQDITDPSTDLRLLRQSHAGKSVAIIDNNLQDLSSSPSSASLGRYLTAWYGLKIVSPSSDTAIDILLLDGASVANGKVNEALSDCESALLLLSNDYLARDSLHSVSSCGARHVDVIPRPYGPHKLARFIQRCLDHRPNKPALKSFSFPKPSAESTEDEGPGPSCANSSDQAEAAVQETEKLSMVIPHRSKDTSREASEEASEERESTSDQRAARILVVEDNKINLNLMLTYLKKRELASLDSAENGSEALDAVKGAEDGYDIIFMDISMPVMNGFEATRAIRSFERGRSKSNKPCKIIALTGLSSTLDEAEALNSGMDLFLTKPVAFKEVKKILERWNETKLGGEGGLKPLGDSA